MAELNETVHLCPPDGSGVTPCCGRTPFEIPLTDRVTVDELAVTCLVIAVPEPDPGDVTQQIRNMIDDSWNRP